MVDGAYHLSGIEIRYFQACRYTLLAGYVIYMYDFLLTYSEVQRLIWPSPMSVVKACYYFNRILVPIGLTINTWQMSGLTGPLSRTFCRRWIATAGYMEVISLGVSDVILLLRVHAIYGRSRKVLFGLLVCFIPSHIATLVTITLGLTKVKDHTDYSLLLQACIVGIRAPILASIWAGPIVFELVIFCMMVYKGVEHAQKVKSISKSPIFFTLYRDGLGYFIVIMMLKLFNLLAWYLRTPSLIFIGIYFIWGVVTMLVSRIVLNLRSLRDPCGHNDLAPQSRVGVQG